ncbi:dihydrofolate reductase [Paenibacillus caseinilyticus]|uniref:Dihydrofolate reductase n=1 Tax=Paenibacillus mucilaginosus K02 TaxID=997761 RepID=I0BC58_9BACL|nr:dihydrofolate reductase [Paenibacillus mucilaginosus]AFH59955.1 dihydrofolate reductase [Paenibacillus mucilaginosus K02]
MTVSYMFAMDEARGLGYQNRMPWYLPADFAYFKQTTLEHTVLMGRKTFDSLGGKPLPRRRNVILTRDKSFEAPGCETVTSPEDAVKPYRPGGEQADEELFVIGGAEIFSLLMPYADRMYITEIHHTFEVDTYFPELDRTEWKEVSRTKGPKDERNPYDYEFVIYERAAN